MFAYEFKFKKMQVTKKQFILYTVILLICAGSISFAVAEKPEELLALWDHLWKVEEPVSIDDNGGSITVDGTVDIGNEITLATGTAHVPGKDIILIENSEIPLGSYIITDPIDVSGYKKIYVYVQYSQGKPVNLYHQWNWEFSNPQYLNSEAFPMGTTDPTAVPPAAIFVVEDVMASRISFIVSNAATSPTTVNVIAYLSPV